MTDGPFGIELEARRDHTLPEGKWTFDQGVAGVFDEMLERSIPSYETMRGLVFELGCSFVRRGDLATIVDLGASAGDAIAPFVEKYGATARYELVEISDPFLEKLRDRFAGFLEAGRLAVRKVDLRTDYPPVAGASLVLSILTLQFTPIEYRAAILRRIFESLRPGGALILVEKVLGSDAALDALFVDRYLALKARNGYSREEIDRKRLSLEGVLVPVSADWNVELLERAGFRSIDSFFRHLNFAGWIAVKP